jgi:hemerythrin-like domain-containing protein
MPFTRQTPQALDDEHRATLALLDRLEHSLTRGDLADWSAQARPLLGLIDTEVAHHFGFEEEALFPRLADAGDGDIAALLAQEHDDIREIGTELRPLAQVLAAHGTLDGAPKAAFRRLGLELVERMVSHIQKETMALLPLLEDLLDEDTDRELAMAHAGA